MSEEPIDPPFCTSERVVPPTEVDTSVGVKGPWVELEIVKNSREVHDFLWLSSEGAEQLADELREVADQLDD
jgi:hypothetical protein